MRTYIFSALAALTLGLLTLGPASAENAPWTCMSPAFACGGAPVAKSYRTQEFAGERTYRRQASSKRNRVAKNDDGVKRAARRRQDRRPEAGEGRVAGAQAGRGSRQAGSTGQAADAGRYRAGQG